MEPLTITLLGIAVSAVLGGAKLSEDKIWNIIAGKKMAVLGARGAGKTTLFNYLNMLNMESLERQQTRTAENTRSSFIHLELGEKNQKTYFKETTDLPGSEDYRDNGKWKESVENADIVLYLVHAAALLKGIDKSRTYGKHKSSQKIQTEIKDRIKDDLQNIQSWLKEVQEGKKKKIAAFIVGNHFDEIDEDFSKPDKIDDYNQEFINNEIIKKYGTGMIKIIGSLKTRDTMKNILKQVVQELETRG